MLQRRNQSRTIEVWNENFTITISQLDRLPKRYVVERLKIIKHISYSCNTITEWTACETTARPCLGVFPLPHCKRFNRVSVEWTVTNQSMFVNWFKHYTSI